MDSLWHFSKGESAFLIDPWLVGSGIDVFVGLEIENNIIRTMDGMKCRRVEMWKCVELHRFSIAKMFNQSHNLSSCKGSQIFKIIKSSFINHFQFPYQVKHTQHLIAGKCSYFHISYRFFGRKSSKSLSNIIHYR